ncbi:hypothetical protein [Streptococcus pneumoniae]|uniref:hypothetical protein n=1 Tax=Streptococcus pneumoniae TaxID=1313 RepID=UPI000B1426AC|nr:hypothetical protein [Streptococcus pneumoniae]MCM0230744.1 hypothetical protein [Streptococcus pneumoniae]
MNLLYHKLEGFLQSFSYSIKIKKQTRKLAAGCSKYCFEVVDKTDEVSSKYCFEVVDKTDEVSSKHCFEVVDRTDEVSNRTTERRS